MSVAPTTQFELPEGLSATEPPEARGLRRDEVRLLVATATGVDHARFADVGRFLSPGDLLVVNTSGTVAAAVDGRLSDGVGVVVHFATPLDDGTWVVELRTAGGSAPILDARPGTRLALPQGTRLTLLAPHGPQPPARDPRGAPQRTRLWVAKVSDTAVRQLLAAHGRPITYGYLHGSWPLAAYQTVFARQPGSAEMPSAGRPFTTRLVTQLVSCGVVVAPILLHTGVSSLERGEAPPPERFAVPASTARLVEMTRTSGGRVVAVGTTVVRALESAASGHRSSPVIRATSGWTGLVLDEQRPARVVDGLVTGLHPPQASHLALLEAVAGPGLVQRAYDEAVANRYLWHEFGDSSLLLPSRLRAVRAS